VNHFHTIIKLKKHSYPHHKEETEKKEKETEAGD
jgi:hypothetical protein